MEDASSYVEQLERQVKELSSQLQRDEALFRDTDEALAAEERRAKALVEELGRKMQMLEDVEASAREREETLRREVEALRREKEEREQQLELQLFASTALNVKLSSCAGQEVRGDLGTLVEQMQTQRWPQSEWPKRIREFLSSNAN